MQEIPQEYTYYGMRFIQTLRNQLKYYGGFLMMICGNPGTGKSFDAISIGETIDPNFDISAKKTNLAFTPYAFLTMLEDEVNYPPGSVIIFDEAGIGMSSRNWYDAVQKMINYALQVVRKRGLIIIFTTPDATFVDSQPRKLFKFFFETKSIDFKRQVSIVSPKKLFTDRKSGKIYYFFPVIQDIEEGNVQIRELLIAKPTKEICKKYEELKIKYNQMIFKEAKESAQSISGELEIGSKFKELNEVEEKVYMLIIKGYTPKKIAEVTQVDPQRISAIKSKIRDKGFPLPMSPKERLRMLEDKDMPTEPVFEKT